ncbi:YcnI family copper-binding membrane protein [Streptomyces daliensis]|uniref:YcnI family protein n=1 Tax=Streptomyces daliensis TaxID=299421 RepID=A0A8T4ILS7_9ACTN|nr:YcnI family protein [Streptomyces daliensis]
MKTSRRDVAAVGALAVSALAAVVLCAGPASAHVSVDPQEAEQGGFGTVSFKVPNERDNASTTKLEVTLPTDHPLASVMPQPVPGWDVDVTKSKLDKPIEMHGEKITEAVTKVTWTGGKIEPGQFQQFPVSLGQLPEDEDQLVFKALQTYDNKEVVRWIEEPEEGQPEPENPAPVLKLTPAAEDEDGHGGGDDGKHADDEESVAASGDDASGTDTTARVLGVVGIVVGVAGVAFGVLAGRRRSA